MFDCCLHEPLEDSGDHDPGREVDTGGRWENTGGIEDEGHVDVPPHTTGIPASEEVEWDGCDGSDEEEPEKRAVPVEESDS